MTKKPGKARPAGWLAGVPALLAWIACSLSALPARAAELQLQLDEEPLYVGESFLVTFRDQGASGGEPDFSPLAQDFEILDTAREQRMSISAGGRQNEHSWTLTLVPKRAGRLRLPPLRFGARFSPERVLQVQAARTVQQRSTAWEPFLEVEAFPSDPYVQAEVRYLLRLYTKVSLHDLEIGRPESDPGTMRILHLGDRRYRKRLRGEDYEVLEQSYSVFPLRSGPLQLEPLAIQGRIGTSRRSFSSLFERNQRRAEPRARPLHLQSRPITLQVRPVPPAFRDKHWLPARELQLTEEWRGRNFRVGEPVTRVLRIIARGSSAGLLPQPELPESEGIRIYPDQPKQSENLRPEGVEARRELSYAVLPVRSGTWILPEVRIQWWNTEQDRAELATLPEARLEVLPAVGRTTEVTPEQPSSAPAAAPAPAPEPAPEPVATGTAARTWPTWLFLLLWLLTSAAWVAERRQRAGGTRRRAPRSRLLKAELRDACRAGDAQRAMRALLRWGRTACPEAPPGCLTALGRRFPELEASTRELNTVLYAGGNGAGEGSWRGGAALWRAWNSARQSLHRNRRRRTATPEAALEPLYRETGGTR